MPLACAQHPWRAFLGSRAGANFRRLLCFSVVLAVGVGYGFYQYSLSAFTTNKGEETITTLQLADAFVNTYSAERARLGAGEAAVPATFPRATSTACLSPSFRSRTA